MSTLQAELDGWRVGLSTRDETAVLVALHNGWPVDGQVPGTAALPAGAVLRDASAREALEASLRRDLVLDPIAVQPSADWLPELSAQLPLSRRHDHAHAGRAVWEDRWLAGRRPYLSRRMSRSGPWELGRLLLRPLPEQLAVTRAATRAAIGTVLTQVNRRERLVYESVLEEPIPPPAEPLHEPMVTLLQRGLVRATSGASGAPHLWRRLRSLLMAIALCDRFSEEGRALAWIWSRREGHRLQRYVGRLDHVTGDIQQAACTLIVDHCARAVEADQRDWGEATGEEEPE